MWVLFGYKKQMRDKSCLLFKSKYVHSVWVDGGGQWNEDSVDHFIVSVCLRIHACVQCAFMHGTVFVRCICMCI